MKAEPMLLLCDGHVLNGAMRARRVTQDGVRSPLRAEGEADLDDVGAVTLETDGALGVLHARPGRAAVPTIFSEP